MRTITRTFVVFAGLALGISACGTGEVVGQPDTPTNGLDPLVQVRSEGGFVPVEHNLGRGPTFTVTRSGRFIFPGAQTLEYPGPLVSPVMEAELTTDQYDRIVKLVQEIGLEGFEDEVDNSVTNVADATTEVIKYWDQDGVHRYSVYALGLTDQPTSDATAAFGELFDYLHEIAGSVEGAQFQPEEIRVVAGVYRGGLDPQFQDRRDWPLEGESPDDWDVFTSIGEETWTCKAFDASVLPMFSDARQTTVWSHPDLSADAENFQLLVRPLHPGEDSCA